MKPYPRYKPTGLAWPPSVPEHWEVRQLKRMARLKGGVGFPVEKQGRFNESFRFIKVNALASRIDPAREYDTISREDVAQLHAQVFPAGSIVFAKVGAALLLRRFEELPFDSCIDNNMMAIFDIKENPKWLRYALSQLDFNRIVNPGAVPSVNQSQVETMPLPLPPPTEQDRIVRYLDEKTAAIDELVRAKEREIDLLRELIVWHAEDAMRTAPKARFRLKRFVRQITEEITVEPGREYHPLGVLNRGRGLFHKEPVLGADLGDSTFFHVHPGDMIISGQFAWEGAVAMLEESERSCVASHRYPLVRSSSDDLRLEYLWAFFQTHYGDMILNLHSHGAAGRNRPLNFGELLNEYVPVPSLDRQATIVELVQKLALIRRTAKTFKDRMAELRTRLVSDAVTGAVEVN